MVNRGFSIYKISPDVAAGTNGGARSNADSCFCFRMCYNGRACFKCAEDSYFD